MFKYPFATLLSVLAFALAQAGGNPPQARQASAASVPERSQAAAHAGLPEAYFAHVAANDRDLKIDRSNRPHYVCTALAAPEGAQVGPDTTPFTNNPITPVNAVSAFKLHSRPGASRVFYLDFTGFTTTGTPWNTAYNGGNPFTTPVFKLPGTLTATDTANLNAIQRIWLSVAEDYAAWDVDVTTERPPTNAVGMRCVIGGSYSDWLGVVCGGIAYLNSVGQTLDGTDTPCYAFPQNLGNSAGNIGECAAHELGHTVGLTHMGEVAHGTTAAQTYSPGHTITAPFVVAGGYTWAPIMGVSYGATISHWTKGDYQYSNNNQDEIAQISTKLNLLTGIRDDHGDVYSTTTSVVSGVTLTAGGIIANNSTGGTLSPDLDCLKIAAGVGALSVVGKAATITPGLHLQIELLDSTGATVATAVTNSSAEMGATLTHTVATSGTYYLRMRGVGFDNGGSTVTGDPVAGYTNYGSIGRYSLTGSWQTVANRPPVAVIGATPTAGVFPVTVNFNGTGSSDPDGIVAGYSWNFGDPASASNTSTLASPSHTYYAPGTYVAKLIVTDNQGLASTAATQTIVVSGSALPNSVHVGGITAGWNRANSIADTASAVVTIVDQYGNPARNAIVEVRVAGLLNGRAAARTNPQGQVTISTPTFRRASAGSFTFTVGNVTLTSYPYAPLQNTPLSGAVTITR